MRRVLLLMLPVTISLGLINFNLLINSFFGSLVSDEAPAAIDKAFRIYQLPQGIFSVAIATVLFPTLARFAARGEIDNLRATMANGMRQILFVLLPGRGRGPRPLRADDPARLPARRVHARRRPTLVATALFWFAFSLPTNGLFLLLTRTFFSLQRPWLPTAIAAGNLVVTALAALALYKPFGVGGIVAATGDRDRGQRRRPVRDPAPRARRARARPPARHRDRGSRSPSAALAAVSFGVWDVLDSALGRGLGGQIVSLGAGLGARRPRLPRRWRGCCGSPSSSRSCACCGAAARCSSAWRATCWASPSSLLLVGLRLAGRRRRPRAGCCPSSTGAPACLATAVSRSRS